MKTVNHFLEKCFQTNEKVFPPFGPLRPGMKKRDEVPGREVSEVTNHKKEHEREVTINQGKEHERIERATFCSYSTMFYVSSNLPPRFSL